MLLKTINCVLLTTVVCGGIFGTATDALAYSKRTATAIYQSSDAAGFAQGIAFDSSSHVPQPTTGIFTLTTTNHVVEWATDATHNEQGGTTQMSGFTIDLQSLGGGSNQDQLWGFQTDGAVYKNVYTLDGDTVVDGTWTKVSYCVPGMGSGSPPQSCSGNLYGMMLVAGYTTYAPLDNAIIVTAPSTSPGWDSTSCSSNSQCGISEQCVHGTCGCPDGSFPIYQRDPDDGLWEPIQGTTVSAAPAGVSGVNTCVMAMAWDQKSVALDAIDVNGNFLYGAPNGDAGVFGWIYQSDYAADVLAAAGETNAAYDLDLVTGNSSVMYFLTSGDQAPLRIDNIIGTSDCAYPVTWAFDESNGDFYWESASNWVCKWTWSDFNDAVNCANGDGDCNAD